MNTTSKPRFFAQAGAITLVLTMLLGSFTAFAARRGGGGSGGSTAKPPTPANFRVTAKTAYTITVAWDPAPAPE
jgi:hypothetical protein